ncbi:hypothetical protein FHG87_006206 [Trinorchestia longiramus]|nr:hypothetical protein FHG87_006206 [Trinorchestia longiramus]
MELLILCLYVANFLVLISVKCTAQIDLNAPIDLEPLTESRKSTVVVVNNKKEARLPFFHPHKTIKDGRNALGRRDTPRISPVSLNFRARDRQDLKTKFVKEDGQFVQRFDDVTHLRNVDSRREDLQRRTGYLDEHNVYEKPSRFRPLTSSDFGFPRNNFNQKATEKVIGTYSHTKSIPSNSESQYTRNEKIQKGSFYGDRTRHSPLHNKADRRKPPILIFEKIPVYIEVTRDQNKPMPPSDHYEGIKLAQDKETSLNRRPNPFFDHGSYHSSPPDEYHPPSYVKDTIYTTEIKETPAQNNEAYHYYDEDVPDNPSHPYEEGSSVLVDETLTGGAVKTSLPAGVTEHVIFENYSPASSTHYDSSSDQYPGYFALSASNYRDPNEQASASFPVSGSSDLDHHHHIRAAAAAEAVALSVLQQQAMTELALNQRLRQITAIMRLQQAAFQAAGRGGPIFGRSSSLKNANILKSQATDPDIPLALLDKHNFPLGQEELEKYSTTDLTDTILNQLKKYGGVEKESSANLNKAEDIVKRLQLIRSILSQEHSKFDFHHPSLVDKKAPLAARTPSSDDAELVEFLLALPEAKFKEFMNMSKQQFLAAVLSNSTALSHLLDGGIFSTLPHSYVYHPFKSIPLAPLPLADSSSSSFLPFTFTSPSFVPTSQSTLFSQFSSPSSILKRRDSGEKKPESATVLPTSPSPSGNDACQEALQPPGSKTPNAQPPASTIYRHQTNSISRPGTNRPSSNTRSPGPLVTHHGTPNFSSSLDMKELPSSNDESESSYSSPPPPFPQSHYGSFRPNLTSFSSVLKRIADGANAGLSPTHSQHQQEVTSSIPFTIPSTVTSPPIHDRFTFTHQIKIINQIPSNEDTKRFQPPTSKPLHSDNDHSSVALKPQAVQSVIDFKDQQPFYTTVSPVLFHSTISHPRQATVKPPFRNHGSFSGTDDVEELTEDKTVQQLNDSPHEGGFERTPAPKTQLDRLQELNVKHNGLVTSLDDYPHAGHNDTHVSSPQEKRTGSFTLEQLIDFSSENELVSVIPLEIQYQEIPSAVVGGQRSSLHHSTNSEKDAQNYSDTSILPQRVNKTVNSFRNTDDAGIVVHRSTAGSDGLRTATVDAVTVPKINPDASILSQSDTANTVLSLSDINTSVLSKDVGKISTAVVNNFNLLVKTTTETNFRASNISSVSATPPGSSSNSFFPRVSPQPQRVDASSFPSRNVDVNAGHLPAVEQTEKRAASIEELIQEFSPPLREPPPCAGSPPHRRSFCLLNQDYPQAEADQLSQKFEEELSEMRSALSQVELPSFSLEEAALQLPTIDPNVDCADIDRTVTLAWARDVVGNWLVVLHTQQLQQIISVKTCSQSAREKGCRPLLLPRPLIAFHPQDKEPKPVISSFSVPIACVFSKQ